MNPPRFIYSRCDAAVALLCGALAMATATTVAAGEVRKGDIVVADPWARASIVPGRPAVVYFTVRNTGDAPDRLVAVASPRAARAHLHETRHEGGVMRMAPVEALTVPPRGALALAPGGTHVMLMGLARPLAEGETVPLTLTFERAGEITVEVVVGKPGAMGAGERKGMGPMPHGH
jgi:hypothetical protein